MRQTQSGSDFRKSKQVRTWDSLAKRNLFQNDHFVPHIIKNQNMILLMTASSLGSALKANGFGLAALRPMAKARLKIPRVFMPKRLRIV